MEDDKSSLYSQSSSQQYYPNHSDNNNNNNNNNNRNYYYYSGEDVSEQQQQQPPPPPPPLTSSSSSLSDAVKPLPSHHVSSLDFEGIVNQYSIQAVRDQWLLPPLPEDGSTSASAVITRSRKRYGTTTTTATTTATMTEATPLVMERPKSTQAENSHTQNNNNNNNNKKGGRIRRRRLRYTSRPHLLGYTGRTATRWFLSALAGLLTGLTTVLIITITGTVVLWRSRNLQSLISNPDYSDDVVFAVFAAFNLAASLASSWLCVMWAVPQAAGSGIPQVKAYLNGIRGDQKFTRFPLLMVKVVGSILSVTSSLAVGQEGPLIHIGAIMGSSCSKISGFASYQLQKFQHCCGDHCCCCWNDDDDDDDDDAVVDHRDHPRDDRTPLINNNNNNNNNRNNLHSWTQRVLSWTTTELSHFATDAERRDLVSIGASCGFAASFGAPIGGLLFILDDISSYFSKGLLLRILVANAIGTFCLAVQHGDLSNYSVINLGTYTGDAANSNIFVNRIEEIPLYIMMGIMGGLLGGFFCWSFVFLRRTVTDKFPRKGKSRARVQLLEVALLSILTSVLIFYVPAQPWACKLRPTTGIFAEHAQLDYTEQYAAEHRERFFCPEGEINELANMLFGSRIDAIKRILADPTQFKQETLLTVGVLFFFLLTLTVGVELPSGIFTPSVLIGAALGGAVGNLLRKFDPTVEPSTYALLGVAGFLAGVQRSTVSLVVILVEGTGQIKVLTPSIIVVVISRYVASLIYKKGIYEAIMEWKKLPYLEHETKRWYDAVEVNEIMSDPPLQTVHPNEKAKDLVDLLAMSRHHGFPVVDPKTNKFLGLVRRDQIAALLECGVMDRNPATNTAWSRPRAGVEKTPLMRWAYHINDDRYDYVLQDTQRQTTRKAPKIPKQKAPKFSVASASRLQTTTFSALPHEFALVHKNSAGLIYVSWLNPDYEGYYVNLGAVMNRGTHCVTEFTPVSKAHRMFTYLGLRHIVVVGGESGGEVVGLLTRANLLPEYIKERTGFG